MFKIATELCRNKLKWIIDFFQSDAIEKWRKKILMSKRIWDEKGTSDGDIALEKREKGIRKILRDESN